MLEVLLCSALIYLAVIFGDDLSRMIAGTHSYIHFSCYLPPSKQESIA